MSVDINCTPFDINGDYAQQLADQRIKVRNSLNYFRMETCDDILYKALMQFDCQSQQFIEALKDLDNRAGGGALGARLDGIDANIEALRTSMDGTTSELSTVELNITALSQSQTALNTKVQTNYDDLNNRLTTAEANIMDLQTKIGITTAWTDITLSVPMFGFLRYRIKNGVVYLWGNVTSPTNNFSGTVAVLPDVIYPSFVDLTAEYVNIPCGNQTNTSKVVSSTVITADTADITKARLYFTTNTDTTGHTGPYTLSIFGSYPL